MKESVLLALIHIFAIVSTINPLSISTRGKKILRGFLRRYLLDREFEEKYYNLFENNLAFYSNELKKIDRSDLSDENSLISFQITNICRQINKGLSMEERTIVFLRLVELTSEDWVMTSQEKNIIDIVAKTFNISKKEYDNATAFIIGRSYDDISTDCILIIESDDLNLSGANIYKNYDKWIHIKHNGFKGRLIILHIESAGVLLAMYDGPLALNFEEKDVIAGRPFLLEKEEYITGQAIEPIYYSQIYEKFVSRRLPEK